MKKGQVAMEFLMTYGWAILVVIAAIGALAYFEVLSPCRFIPDGCLNITSSVVNVSIDDTGLHTNYDRLNYTTLNITREDFTKLSESRQNDWMNGVCYPASCKVRNPPVCLSIYAVYCQNDKEINYFDNMYIKEARG